MIELWERQVEIANWLDLIPSVQHNHMHRTIHLPCPFPPMLAMPRLRPPPKPRDHGLDAASSPHHKQVGDRQSHATTNSIIIKQMQLGHQLKTAISACIPPKLPAKCCSERQLQQKQQQTNKNKNQDPRKSYAQLTASQLSGSNQQEIS